MICFAGCTKEISLDVAHEPQTIIYGSISNETSPVSIHILQSVHLQDSSPSIPINNASVSLYTKDISGNTNLVTDNFIVNNGVYTSTQSISATIGNLYWIEVLFNDGTLCKSKQELLKPVVSLQGVNVSIDNEFMQVFFDDPINDKNFYKINLSLLNNGQIISSNNSIFNDLLFDGIKNTIVNVNFLNRENTPNEIIFNQKKITLSNINTSSYQFYLNQIQQLETNNNESIGDPGQLFATPPVNLIGNIINTNTNKVILGNFTVNSIDTILIDIQKM